jgi:hypothetical protein
MWLSGDRRDPSFEYVILRDEPLTLGDQVTYTDGDGKTTSIRGVDRWNGSGFTWKLNGLRGLFVTSRWEVAGVRQGLVVLRFEKSLVSPAGVDVIVAEGLDATELRSVIAADPASFGLSIEEFASLTWLDHLPAH